MISFVTSGFYDIICNITVTGYFWHFLRQCHIILPMISHTYHMKIALISMTYDINDLWRKEVEPGAPPPPA
jgi:hypothetical protein